MKYRQEWKYICTQAQLDVLRHRLLPVMKYDQHQVSAGTYHIRSVYFDDMRNSGMQENEDGLDCRKKFRIRIYNRSADLIHLEIKFKRQGMTHKESCTISSAGTAMRRILPERPSSAPYSFSAAAMQSSAAPCAW